MPPTPECSRRCAPRPPSRASKNSSDSSIANKPATSTRSRSRRRFARIASIPLSRRSVFLKDAISIEATVDAYLCGGEKARVELLEGNQVIENKEVKISGDSYSERVVFTPPATSLGVHEYTLRIAELPRESLTDNN